MSKNWLENASWAAQIVLAIIAVLAAIFAFAQIRAFKLFEMLKYIEAREVRKSRRIVLRKIFPRKDEEWWNDEELESAASDVCASYDILGLVIENDPRGGYEIFEHYWARSILDTHVALEGFLRHRRLRNSNAYGAFTRLANKVKPYAGIVPGAPLQPH
jgi:hypothetical protein